MSFIFGDAGAGDAARATTEAANVATAEQRRQYDLSRADMQPFLQTGRSAMEKLAALYGIGPDGAATNAVDPNASFYQSPDYQFRLNQGIKGVDAGAAARGALDSGATRKAEINYVGNLASGEFGNYANRLANLAGVGQTTANNSATLNSNYANSIGQIAQNAGNNKASSYLAAGQNSPGNQLFKLAGAALPFLL